MKGEFKKRLAHYKEQHDKVKIQRIKHIRTTLNVVNADVDEAQKEFPKFADMANKTATPLEGLVRVLQERDQWFVKWFGDEGGE